VPFLKNSHKGRKNIFCDQIFEAKVFGQTTKQRSTESNFYSIRTINVDNRLKTLFVPYFKRQNNLSSSKIIPPKLTLLPHFNTHFQEGNKVDCVRQFSATKVVLFEK